MVNPADSLGIKAAQRRAMALMQLNRFIEAGPWYKALINAGSGNPEMQRLYEVSHVVSKNVSTFNYDCCYFMYVVAMLLGCHSAL